MIEKEIPLVEEIFGELASVEDIGGYKNHVYRVINFCSTLSPLDAVDREKIHIAACFHDLGLFNDSTFDYIPPSVRLAREYLSKTDRSAWSDEIASVIEQHHCLHAIDGEDKRLPELFRKADLVDFSLGLFRFGIKGSEVSAVKSAFPNSGFHCGLARTAAKWIIRHPLNPVPVLRW